MADLKTVKAKESENQLLYDRMDGDKNLKYLAPFVMVDDDKEPVPDIVNVTLNMPATFEAHVHAAMVGADQQILVTGDDLDEKKHQAETIQDLIIAAFEEVDRQNKKKGRDPLRPFLTEQDNMRGRMATRTLFRSDGKGGINADILPIDTRFLTYQYDDEGLLWANIKSFRSPEDARAEYPAAIIPPRSAQSLSEADRIEVNDHWDRQLNTIWVSTSVVKRETHGLKSIPIDIEIVPMGSMLQDKDADSHYGESIYYLIRGLVPELNRLASVHQTLAQKAANPAYGWPNQDGGEGKPPKGIGESGTTTALDLNQAIGVVPQGDMKNAGRTMMQILSEAIQNGSLDQTALGNPGFPLSAVAIIKLGESSGAVFLPRLGAYGLMMQAIAERFIEQLIEMKPSQIEFGTRGHKQKFDYKDLEGDYDIAFMFTIQSPEEDVARISIAAQMEKYMSPDDIGEKVLKFDKPAEMRRRKRVADAELLSPIILMRRTIRDLIDEGEHTEAQILLDQLELTLEQFEETENKPKSGAAGTPPAPIPLRGTRESSNTEADLLRPDTPLAIAEG